MRVFVVSALLLFASSVFAQTNFSAVFPEPIGWVNDFEQILDSVTENELTNLINAHQDKTTNQIAIVTISSIEPYDSFAVYATALSNYWGVGEKKTDNGLTIVFSKTLREVRISTGVGLEKKLTDAMCQKVIDEIMIPNFKTGNYSKGLIEGLRELIRLLESLH